MIKYLWQKNKYSITIGGLVFIYTAFFNYICFKKYFAFSYFDWDLAIYNNFFYNGLRGSFYSTLLGTNFFGNHLNLFIFFLFPIYYFFQNPCTLLFLQTFFLAIAVYPLYMIVTKESNSDKRLGLLFVVLYLLHPGIQYTNLNEFHLEVFFPFLFFLTFYFLKCNRNRPAAIFAILCLMLKENFSLVIMMLGLYCIFDNKRRVGVFLLLISLIWFYFAFFVIIPPLNKGVVGLSSIYPKFGNNPAQILKNIILHPALVIETIFIPKKINYVLTLLFPLGLMSIFDLKTLLIASPLFLQHLLSSRTMEYNLNFYYSVEMLPVVFISAFYGCKWVLTHQHILRRKNLIFLILVMSITSFVAIGPISGVIRSRNELEIIKLDLKKYSFLKLIPDDASVVATFMYLPQLSNRKELYSFHYVYSGRSILSKLTYMLPDTVEYALMDFNDPQMACFMQPLKNYPNFQKFFSSGNWRVINLLDSTVLLKRDVGSEISLYQVSNVAPSPQKRLSYIIKKSIELLGYDVSSECGKFHLTFYWRCIRKTDKDIAIYFQLVDKNGNIDYVFSVPLCYRIYPSTAWKPGEYIKEIIVLPFASDVREHGSIWKMGFYDYQTNRSYILDEKNSTESINLDLK